MCHIVDETAVVGYASNMTNPPTARAEDSYTLPKTPDWVTSQRAETLENVAFQSGAALTVLEQLITDSRHGVPVTLLANRLALKAATATSKLEGRLAREADIRDAYHLTPAGEARGPDGDLLAFWRDAAHVKLVGRDWYAAIKDLVGVQFEADALGWLKESEDHAKSYGPFAACVAVMRAVLDVDDRAERVSCLLSDVVLARALNWGWVLPVTAQRLTKALLRDLVVGGKAAELTLQQYLLETVEQTTRTAQDFALRASALRVAVPKLRAKGAEAAVSLFLSEDAVAPSSMLSPMIQGSTMSMTDRAARRFCDRLVDLGVARELTGRATFRLYGVAP